MTKLELVNKVFKEYECGGAYKKQIIPIVDAVFDAIAETVASGEDVNIVGFGKFACINKPAQELYHPATKELIIVPEHKMLRFKQSDVLKKRVRGE